MIDISKIKKGDKVRYQPSHYDDNEWENGIVKEVPDFATDPKAVVGKNCVRVVYNCAGNWRFYENYTSALTSVEDLKLGWKH